MLPIKSWLLGRNSTRLISSTIAIRRLHRHILQCAQAATVTKLAEQTNPDEQFELRNIGISAHIDSGKTTVTERILYYAGRINEMHEVRGKDKVGATMDYMELERQRGITIQSAATHVEWRGVPINIIDTPGHVDFTVEVERALRVLDGAVLVLCGVAGVQSQTLTVNRQMTRYNVPFITFINKLDRMGASADICIRGLREKLKHNAALVQLPIGKESNFKGVVDLVAERAFYFDDVTGETMREADIPDDFRVMANDRRAELIEHAANGDEQLCELYMNEHNPTTDQLRQAIRRATINRQFTPVFCGSALKNKGIQLMVDGIVDYLPNPTQVKNYALLQKEDGTEEKVHLNSSRASDHQFLAMAFKLEKNKHGQMTFLRIYQGKLKKGDTVFNTLDGRRVRISRIVRMHAQDMSDIDVAYAGDIVAVFGLDCASGTTLYQTPNVPISMESMFVPEPVISMSIEPANNKDSDRFMEALNRFTKEDPTFRKSYDPESRQTIVSGMGELHLEIYSQRMKNEYGCEVKLGKPHVAFRETIKKPQKFDHWHRQQTGGQGQYGRIRGICEPMPSERNTHNELIDETIGGCIPKGLFNPLRKGFQDMLDEGPLIGMPIVGLRMRVQDGATHEVDSTEIAMINTAKGAMRDLFGDAQWGIIEPIMSVEVQAPMKFQNDVTQSLNARQGVSVSTGGTDDGSFLMTVEVPLNCMFGYATELRSLTEGKGEFSMEYTRYAPVDQKTHNLLVENYMKAQEAAAIKTGGKKKKK